MPSLINAITKNNEPFTYFHTHVITDGILAAAIESRVGIEIDIAVNEDGSHYIGHPPAYYRFKGLAQPRNLPLNEVLDRAYEAGLFLVIDCKDARAMPKAKEISDQGLGEIGAF